MQGSETLTVLGALTDAQKDRNGDPKPGVTPPAPRDVPSCVIIPRRNPDTDAIIVDEYQVIMTDASYDPPQAEDSIKIPSNRFIDPSREWYIDGGVGPYTKPSGDVKAIEFFIKSVR